MDSCVGSLVDVRVMDLTLGMNRDRVWVYTQVRAASATKRLFSATREVSLSA